MPAVAEEHRTRTEALAKKGELEMSGTEPDRSKREFMITVAYVTPVVATLAVMPTIASAGSQLQSSAIEPSHPLPRVESIGESFADPGRHNDRKGMAEAYRTKWGSDDNGNGSRKHFRRFGRWEWSRASDDS